MTILVITHDPELVAACCDHAMLMEKGRVAWWGRIDEPRVAQRIEEFSADVGALAEAYRRMPEQQKARRMPGLPPTLPSRPGATPSVVRARLSD